MQIFILPKKKSEKKSKNLDYYKMLEKKFSISKNFKVKYQSP